MKYLPKTSVTTGIINTSDELKLQISGNEWEEVPPMRCVAERLAESLQVSKRHCVLDMTVGGSEFLDAVLARGAQTTAVDQFRSTLQPKRASAVCAETVDNDVDHQSAKRESRLGFDIVGMIVHNMHLYNSERVVADIMKAARPGARIGIVCWSPHSFLGQALKLIDSRYSTLMMNEELRLWGVRSVISSFFQLYTRRIEFRDREITFNYRNPEQWLSIYQQDFVPLRRAYALLDHAGIASLTRDLLQLASEHNRSQASALALPVQYLESIVHVSDDLRNANVSPDYDLRKLS